MREELNAVIAAEKEVENLIKKKQSESSALKAEWDRKIKSKIKTLEEEFAAESAAHIAALKEQEETLLKQKIDDLKDIEWEMIDRERRKEIIDRFVSIVINGDRTLP